MAGAMATAEAATKKMTDQKAAIQDLATTITDDLGGALAGIIDRSRTWEQSLASLGKAFIKMALDAALLGKGPLATLMGKTPDDGLASGLGNSIFKGIAKDTSKVEAKQFLPAPAIPIKSASEAASTGGGTDSAATANLDAGGRPAADALTRHMMTTYGLTREQASGATGNMGYESGDFKTLQEKDPQGGGRGGLGYAQWTGPRRTEFEQYSKQQGLDPNSYAANQGMIDHDLQGRYSGTIDALKATDNPQDASRAWSTNFEGMREGGPGVPAFGEHAGRAQQYYDQGVGNSNPAGDAAEQLAAQQKLAEALAKTKTSATSIVSPLQSMDATLAKGGGSAESFTTSIGKLVSGIMGGAGGGGGGAGVGEFVNGFGAAPTFGFAAGGHVRGPGTGTSDSIPAMLSHGEFVTNAKATSKHRGLLESINSGRVPKFAAGGMVGGDTFAHTSSYSPTTHISIAGSGNARTDAALAQRVQGVVSGAMEKQQADRFRRSGPQMHAAAFQAGQRAATKHG
jgi:hypothetical protein